MRGFVMDGSSTTRLLLREMLRLVAAVKSGR
jgi:hypothetical protein